MEKTDPDIQHNERVKRAEELLAANLGLAFRNEEREKRAAELLVVNKELAFQNEEKEKRAAELLVANIELAFQNEEKEKRAAELLVANIELAFQNEEKEKRAAELLVANKELAFQNEEKEKRAAELLVANKELAFQNEEKEKRAAELLVANKELAFQNEEKEKRAAELLVANIELAFQNEEKEKRAAELLVANIELAFQNEEKEKRAEELLVANIELAFQNKEKEKRAEELLVANKELTGARENLLSMVHDLAASETRLRFMFEDAPIGISILDGRNLVVEFANKKMLEIWGKSKSIIHSTLRDALPELEGQPFLEILDEVFSTGIAYYGSEVKAMLERGGLLEENYFNYVFNPIADITGKITSIMVVASVITEQVTARKKMQKAEEQLRFSIESAAIGTWYINGDTQYFVSSSRLKELFGFHSWEEVTFDAAYQQILPAYREMTRQAMNQAMTEGVNFNIEHPVLGYHDKKIRWLKSIGKYERFDGAEQPNFSGICIDITDQKLDEVRKNDFIGIVSHELKTPLTYLKGYVQLLIQRAEKASDDFLAATLKKAERGVDKMTVLIDGFLNISLFESGRIKLDLQAFDVVALIKEIVIESGPVLKPYHLEFKPCNPSVVFADRDKIGQVLTNFLSNAAKYSPTGSSIEITCEHVEDMVTVCVLDNGVGISDEDKYHVFDRFYRVESNQNKIISGFGIGLYLCAEIIYRHDGKIQVENNPAGGTVFSFSLMLKEG